MQICFAARVILATEAPLEYSTLGFLAVFLLLLILVVLESTVASR